VRYAVSFGGADDGHVYDDTADPPFGYRVKRLMHRGKARKLFIPNSMSECGLDAAILHKTLDRADAGIHSEEQE